jgi:hypothetical protein
MEKFKNKTNSDKTEKIEFKRGKEVVWDDKNKGWKYLVRKMETFKIVTYQGSRNPLEPILKEVKGERILINKRKCFIFVDPEETEQGTVNGWNVSDVETGMCLAINLSKSKAIELASQRLKKYPDAVKKGLQRLNSMDIKTPVNL